MNSCQLDKSHANGDRTQESFTTWETRLYDFQFYNEKEIELK